MPYAARGQKGGDWRNLPPIRWREWFLPAERRLHGHATKIPGSDCAIPFPIVGFVPESTVVAEAEGWPARRHNRVDDRCSYGHEIKSAPILLKTLRKNNREIR